MCSINNYVCISLGQLENIKSTEALLDINNKILDITQQLLLINEKILNVSNHIADSADETKVNLSEMRSAFPKRFREVK